MAADARLHLLGHDGIVVAGAVRLLDDRVLGDPALAARLGGAATRTARETFALERTVERTLALYREVVELRGA